MRSAIPVVLFLLLAACSAHTGVASQTLRERSDREVAALLERVAVYDDRELTAYLTEIAERLAGSGVRVTVLADSTLAAFAMPGGHLFVHTGLLSALEDEAEVAAIFARELSREAAGLVPRPSKIAMSPVALSPTAAAALGLDLRLVIAAAIDGDGPAADVDAARRLAAAGYDPAAEARVFRRPAGESAERAGLAEIFFYGRTPRVARDSGGVASAGEFARRMRRLVRDNAALDLRAGRFALAERQLDRALAIDPDDAVAQLYRGELDRLRSQRATGEARTEGARKAVERYRRALQLDPRSAEPLRQLALVQYQQGNLAEARASFERYLAADPNAPDARRIRHYLTILGPRPEGDRP